MKRAELWTWDRRCRVWQVYARAANGKVYYVTNGMRIRAALRVARRFGGVR